MSEKRKWGLLDRIKQQWIDFDHDLIDDLEKFDTNLEKSK